MDTIITIILAVFLTTDSNYVVYTENGLFTLDKHLIKPRIGNYFTYGIPNNKFLLANKDKKIYYIEAK
jgi:hypothetical protein